VANKDIGFVHEGQDAIVKVETFNFTKYGYLDGTVKKVSRDAVIDKELGLYYLAHIALEQTAMSIDGRQVPIEPGMAVTVEVKMGERRVIEFLLSPLLRYQQESGRER
jgi:hemolysin D